jgi:phosphopantetheine adenylyltransferase
VHLVTCRPPIQKFLRNHKFRYLEQAAKKKYVVEIMSEEGPAISAADNEELKAKNEESKKALRIVKDRLGEKQKDIRDLVPLVEEGSVPSLFYVAYDSDG